MRVAGLVLVLAAAVCPVMADGQAMPLGGVRFEENRGQVAAQVRYLARAHGQQVFLTDRGVWFTTNEGAVVEMTFAGAARAQWVAEGQPVGAISYMVGRDAAQWVKGAPMFERALWRGVYPGIDVAFYGQGDRLEYDLIVGKGADWRRVEVRFTGGGAPELKPDGTVEVGQVLRQRAPEIYQESADGVRTRVAGGFRQVAGGGLRLDLGEYANERRLVIDPVLEAASYIGGENDDEVVALADGLLAGNTRSLTFSPTFPTIRKGRDVFLMGRGIIPGLTSNRDFFGILVFGGSGDDQVTGVGTAPSRGYAYLAGTTTSTDLPNVVQSSYKGGASDGFIASINYSSAYASVASCVYIGGTGEDRINGMAVSSTLLAVVGSTTSTDLAVATAPYEQYHGGGDAFFAVSGAFLSPSPVTGYLGGSGEDAAYAVDIGRNNRIWIGGETRSADFAFSDGELSGASDGFLAVATPNGSYTPASVEVTAYRVGGSGEDSVRAVAARATVVTEGGSSALYTPFTLDGVAFGGATTSLDLPVRSAAQPKFGGERDGFVGMWKPTANAPGWLTYVGGTAVDEVAALTQNWAGDVVVGGWTRSADLPVVSPLQERPGGGEDGLFAIYDSAGPVRHLGYYGGTGDDRIRAVRMVWNDRARIAGSTTSTDLPEVAPIVPQGRRTDGFMADIASDYLMAPGELILAKDGMLMFSVRTGRNSFREALTYRSKDPSKVRLVYLGRSFDKVTAAAEANMGLEALADTGEAEIEVSAPGYPVKTIRVKLYPSAFLVSTNTPVVSTWSTGTSAYAYLTAIDPVTRQSLGISFMSRPGLGLLNFRWTVSDPSLVEAVSLNNQLQLRALRPGEFTVSLTVDGFTVLPLSRTMTVATPTLVLPSREFRLGKDLMANLPATFAVNGVGTVTGTRGTLTARSGDPAKLLISTSPDRPGKDEATMTIGQYSSGLWAQALADSGTVPVTFTSTEFSGEVTLNVTLEPAVIRWGVWNPSVVNLQLDSELSLKAGTQVNLTVSAQSESGATGGFRPGAPPVTLTVANSRPQTLELNRLTMTLLQGSSGTYSVRGLAPGRAELTMSLDAPGIRLGNSTVTVNVQAAEPMLANVPAEVSVGKGLQTNVQFRYPVPGTGIEVISDDPAAAILSTALTARGSTRLVLTPSGDSYSFWVQALRADGETTVRVRTPNGEEQRIKVLLLPAGAGFAGSEFANSVAGLERGIRIGTWALDRASGVGVFRQPLQPGGTVRVRVRADGSAVRVEPAAVQLSVDNPEPSVAFGAPPAGQEAMLVAETDGEFAGGSNISRLRVRTPAVTTSTGIASMTMMRDSMARQSVSVPAGRTATLTSSDPERLLISAAATDTPSATINLSRDAEVFLHALAGTGQAKVNVEVDGQPPREIVVAFQPLEIYFYTTAPAPVGGSAEFTASANMQQFRPGAGPYKLRVRSENTSIATVDTPVVELGGTVTWVRLRVQGVAAGVTQLLVDAPPEVFITPSPVMVLVSPPTAQTVPLYTLGNNLMGSAQLDLGADFVNPNGAILTLTSSDPIRLVLSRSAAVAGSATLNVTAPAGSRSTQTVYFQALGQGEVSVRAEVNGTTRNLATFRIVPAWWTCGTSSSGELVAMAVGEETTVSCYPRYVDADSRRLEEIAIRPGLSGLTLGVASSDPAVFEVETRSLALDDGARNVRLRGVAAGYAELRLTQPSGFGPDVDGSATRPVRVQVPQLRSYCNGEFTIGIDTQRLCEVSIRPGVTITATSSNPALLLVSSDAAARGSASATVTTSSSGTAGFYIQALANSGTAEIVFSAPGYADIRAAFALRPSYFYLSNIGSGNTLSLRTGAVASVSLKLRGTDNDAPARAGANLTVGLATVTPGVASIEPARVVWDTSANPGVVQIRATNPGSTVIAITQPTGFSQPVIPFVVTVSP